MNNVACAATYYSSLCLSITSLYSLMPAILYNARLSMPLAMPLATSPSVDRRALPGWPRGNAFSSASGVVRAIPVAGAVLPPPISAGCCMYYTSSGCCRLTAARA
ncbi:hypothetical protein NPIL_332421 [Nephila pilipes]|uniref:Uncharacterized protein n=1 Tax=Nephila pilipes TaxID=299642 RepID=A0A8X6MUF8_NEPPI|nr:hypothetical protein NPIL_332421 [Nephila pilipes]